MSRRIVVSLTEAQARLLRRAAVYMLELDEDGDGLKQGGPDERALEAAVRALDAARNKQP